MAFHPLPRASTTFEAIQIDNSTKTLVVGIHVGKDTVEAPVGILGMPGAIKVSLPAGSNGTTGYLYIPGTKYFVFIGGHTGFVVLDSVPAGIIPAVSYSSTNSAGSAVIRYDVTVSPAIRRLSGTRSGNTRAGWRSIHLLPEQPFPVTS